MKKILLALACSLVGLSSINAQKNTKQLFPDGTPISIWFTVNKKVSLPQLGKAYVITDYGVKNDSTLVQTEAIQKIIDIATEKGGVIVIPQGTFLSGALFFKPKTHLHVVEGGKLKGSNNIEDYPKLPSRMEGQSLDYFTALVNAYQVDGFTISGKGTIDGNGLKYWQAFWQRRKENPNCTNLEVSRPRLVFIWKSNNVQIQDVKLHNSGFWTTHLYQCNNVKVLDAHIFSPEKPVKAPSTDAIDIDACTNVLVKGCYLSVNDDAIALKGGKGPWADKVPNNGANKNIIIEDCEFGFCHSALTCGSEAIHNRNIIMRNCYVNEATRVLWLKMRPDTPQLYEYILVENVKGNSHSLLFVKPWKQFFDLQGRKDVPLSYSDHVTLRNIEVKCDIFYDVAVSEYDKLSNFTFENFKVESKNPAIDKSVVKGFTLKNVVVNGTSIK
ncbi:glycosyl hydrolase family 28 protein [Flectobacillus sp. DC10W]|uniref:Glycosyl hydrolase family 28 protein n=1 Tax=Flectobacillus longus TaxID=2984207 RepID=A0ABT6YS15_9BACT|nr:glycosyl hydrolase family 28 protein [Flectobacillus longus]MDI9866369.1 glycosyl hydrolase family 28 protein [Flectobacillus longus]